MEQEVSLENRDRLWHTYLQNKKQSGLSVDIKQLLR